ncbi:MAG TPA: hypothetical protein VFE05_12695 [Longimicrobiaceae bacterium]|jgi:hypothetical protein|nr:hypothetical protein [Longimicrobiaceae bacterium]
MQKLKLELDALAVESFMTGDATGGDGTVLGQIQAEKPTTSMNDQMTCGQNSCAGVSCYTCSICMSFDYMCINPD